MRKLIIPILVISAFVLSGCSEPNPEMDAFAQCLYSKNFKMYGTETCPHCQAQKAMFGESFQYINYTGCDTDKQACIDANVEGVPAWDYPGGERLVGTQELETLAEKSGCELPQEGE